MRRIPKQPLFIFWALVLLCSLALAQPNSRPNIVVILVDDMKKITIPFCLPVVCAAELQPAR